MRPPRDPDRPGSGDGTTTSTRGTTTRSRTGTAYGKALGLLARREHSRAELKTKLARGGHAADEAEAAIASLGSGALQSDARFAAALARSRAGQGYGPRRIVAELKSHAIGDALIREALAELDVDWAASARRQLERQYGAGRAVSPRDRARQAGFLLRRGFDGPTVGAVTRTDFGGEDDGSD
ncbi:MAG: recombination regulator RecX [Rhodanobacter denitrificans]|uniref:Regulatory protein RecX n=1 Tax=Rhodanobacter denitrificans TaxID=666685 RepID=A0A2W5K091_9GAMM|nr:MAG: recombination regulator RecX [Rhodanobacter denitrificans]